MSTTDGGQHWQRRTAPKVAIDNGNPPTVTAVSPRTVFVDRYVDHVGSVLRSTDGGQSWQRIRVAKPQGQQILGVARIVQHLHTVYAVINTIAADGSGNNWVAVYTMKSTSDRLVTRGDLYVTAELPYGDVVSRGGILQVVLGSYGQDSRYWYSFLGRRFHTAPTPCAPDQQAVLGGLATGRPVAACNGPSGTPQPGHSPKQLAAADRLARPFTTIGNPAPTAGAAIDYAQPSRSQAVFAATGGDLILIYATADAGQHWETTFSRPGFAPKDLSFVSRSTGTFVALGVEPEANRLYRTTDAGESWSKLGFAVRD